MRLPLVITGAFAVVGLAVFPAPLVLALASSTRSTALQQLQTQLGTLRIAPIVVGSLNHFGQDNDQQSIIDILEKVPTNTLIDTAELYGDGTTEEVLRDCIAKAGWHWNGGSNDDSNINGLYCATKYAPNIFRRSPEDVVQACQESIRKLGCDQIDLYQAHYAAKLINLPLVPNVEEETVWEGLALCYERGLVRNIGVCNYGPTLIRRAHDYFQQRSIPLVSNQINYNLMRASAAQETADVCDNLGIAVLAYHPLGKGTLTGKYDDADDFAMRAAKGQYQYFALKRWLKATTELRAALSKTAVELSSSDKPTTTSMSQVAVSWILRKGRIPIVGARTADQAQDLLEAARIELTGDQVVVLDEAASLVRSNWTILGKEFALE